MAMKTKKAMKSSIIWICFKKKRRRETKFPVPSSSEAEKEERLVGLVMVLG